MFKPVRKIIVFPDNYNHNDKNGPIKISATTLVFPSLGEFSKQVFHGEDFMTWMQNFLSGPYTTAMVPMSFWVRTVPKIPGWETTFKSFKEELKLFGVFDVSDQDAPIDEKKSLVLPAMPSILSQ